jgi:hypothetical protein
MALTIFIGITGLYFLEYLSTVPKTEVHLHRFMSTLYQVTASPITLHQLLASPITLHQLLASPITLHQLLASPITLHQLLASPAAQHQLSYWPPQQLSISIPCVSAHGLSCSPTSVIASTTTLYQVYPPLLPNISCWPLL